MNGQIRAHHAMRFVVPAIAAVACIAAAGAGASTGSTTVTLHPGQSKKVGIYTVVCTAKTVVHKKARIVLHVGYAVTVRGVRIRCLRVSIPTPAPVPVPTPTPVPVPIPPPALGTRSNPIPLGQAGPPVTSFLGNGTFAITVNSVNSNAWSIVQAENMFNDPPAAGANDVMVNLKVHYDGTQAADISDLGAFLDAVGQSGISYSSARCGVLPSPREIDYSNIFPGATFGLNWCWQVPLGDVSSLEMFWSGTSTPGPFWLAH